MACLSEKSILSSKVIHWLLLGIIIISFLLCICINPSSWIDTPSRFGTLGFFITLYGVLFAAVELIRLKSAAIQATNAAQNIFKQINTVYTTRDISECQGKIEMAIINLDNGLLIASSNLLSITRTYSQIFTEEMNQEDSRHRLNKSYIESYTFNPSSINTHSSPNVKLTRSALLAIASDLAALQGKSNKLMEP
ncbi:hypothetical protein [Rahnella sp. PAMC 25559]|uniref:hypothetical protein n=1 Tax=Rahnella sp. PAMC 25559 TaxID=3423225 RepID=UPI003D67F46E